MAWGGPGGGWGGPVAAGVQVGTHLYGLGAVWGVFATCENQKNVAITRTWRISGWGGCLLRENCIFARKVATRAV